MAFGGLLAMLVALALLPPFGSAAPRWAWRFFLIWSLGVPYWQWVEYRWLNDGSADFLRQQGLSRSVWAGGVAVLATYLLAGVR